MARSLAGTLLLGLFSLLAAIGSGPIDWAPLLVAIGYAAAALTVSVWGVQHPVPLQPGGHIGRRWWMATVGVDLLAFSLLLVLGGRSVNVAALLVLPMLMSAALMPRRPALAIAAAVVLLQIGHAGLLSLTGLDLASSLTQAGLTGAGLLAISLLTSELAERLARQELAARSTLELARQQARLNRLMIEEMPDGVMVVDRQGRVRAANPAALALIGAARARRFQPFDLQQTPAWQPLLAALQEAFATGTWPQAGQELALPLPLGAGAPAEDRRLRLRMRFTRSRGARSEEELGVVFMEDMRTLRARARQEKLAAMGRVSAGIAHEIRNPLAAIAQANALLAEDLDQPGALQLTRMVEDNVQRLQRLVDDVLEAVPGAPPEAPWIDLGRHVATLCRDWAHTAGLPDSAASPMHVDLGDETLTTRIDPEHLRRVLVNLLDNALRHGSGQPQAIWVRCTPAGPGQALLTVASDGPPIGVDVEPYLFEPFFSTRSRGSGLGLYICRELCERYGGTIEYQPRGAGARHRNVFLVTLPRAAAATGGHRPRSV